MKYTAINPHVNLFKDLSIELGEPKKLFLIDILPIPVAFGTRAKIIIIKKKQQSNQKIFNIWLFSIFRYIFFINSN